MGLMQDLSPEVVANALPGRPVRSYPAMLSTEADALAWARAGGPEGALVVAEYQAAPRGRAGHPLAMRPGEGLGFSLVLRPQLPVEREGWIYAVAVSGLADVVGEGAAITWPDEVRRGGERVGAVGVQVQLGAEGTEWAVTTVLMEQAYPPRAPLLSEVVDAIEQRYRGDPETVLTDYLPRCATLGRKIRARLIPVGPAGPTVVGLAVDCLLDGALVLETERRSRVAIRPHHLGLLEEAL